jgi:hypothetical protein
MFDEYGKLTSTRHFGLRNEPFYKWELQGFHEHIIADFGESVFKISRKKEMKPYAKDLGNEGRLFHNSQTHFIVSPSELKTDGLKLIEQMKIEDEKVAEDAIESLNEEKWQISTNLQSGIPLPLFRNSEGIMESNSTVSQLFQKGRFFI